MFLYLKTGGGHLAPAKAVAEKIRSKHKNVKILLEDGLKTSPPFVRRILEGGYKSAVNNALWTYELLYLLHKIPIVAKITSVLVSYFLKPGIEKLLLETRPDKIVIFHFFLIKPVYELIQKHGLNIPVLTVVTDPFTAHPIWFMHKEQKFIVFSEMLKEKCKKMGIDEDNLKLFPFIVNQKFSRKISNAKALEIRKELGFRNDSSIILIMGGGDGMPHGKKIIKHLIRSNTENEFAVVCGHNLKMYNHVSKLKDKNKLNNLKIFGFVDFIHSLISISDIIITKCGASTFMEILLSGKVPLIYNYVWEQEKGNKDFVCNNGMGIYERKPKKLPVIINNLLNDRANYENIRGAIKKRRIANGTEPVSEYILNF